MKVVYPTILTRGEKYILASIPDCDIATQGADMADAMAMARDAICMWCIAETDDGRVLPPATDMAMVPVEDGDIITLIDADVTSYRKKLETRTIRKNLTIPSWLNDLAEKEGINFSQVLQAALKEKLQAS